MDFLDILDIVILGYIPESRIGNINTIAVEQIEINTHNTYYQIS